MPVKMRCFSGRVVWLQTNQQSLETYEIKKPFIDNDRDRVYNEIFVNGGITCKELAEQWGCPSHCISGRFTELRELGLIAADGKKYLPNYKGQLYPHTIWRCIR